MQNKLIPPIVLNTITNPPLTPQARPEQRNLNPVTYSTPYNSSYHQNTPPQNNRGRGGRGRGMQGGNGFRGGFHHKQSQLYNDQQNGVRTHNRFDPLSQ